jgi:hypothetical protein
MSSLHEVVYQIVLNPQLFVEMLKNPQEFGETFMLSGGEVQALVAMSPDTTSLQRLLSPETLKNATQSLLESVWVPPTYP